MMDPVQHCLGNTIEMNRQLHESVQRKQDEISALQERNAQLKEMVRQAQMYAAVLDAFMPQLDDTSECVSHPATAFTPDSHSYSFTVEPSDWHVSADLQPSWFESLLDHTPLEEEEESLCGILSEYTNTGVKRQLWPSDTDFSPPVESPDKKSRLNQDFHEQSEGHFSERLGSETVQVSGSFRGLQVSKAMPSATSDSWRDGRGTFFKTSVREHSTVRTKVFPHGKAFTSHTPDGGCRFLWIPKHN